MRKDKQLNPMCEFHTEESSKNLTPMWRFLDDEEAVLKNDESNIISSKIEKGQKLQPMIQYLPENIVVSEVSKANDTTVNQNAANQNNSSVETENMSQILAYIPYNCCNIDTMPFTQIQRLVWLNSHSCFPVRDFKTSTISLTDLKLPLFTASSSKVVLQEW